MTTPGPVPQQVQRLEHEIARLRRIIEESQRRTLFSAAIGAGGLRVYDNGAITVENSTGGTVFVVDGTHQFAFYGTDGTRLLASDAAGGLAEPWMSVPLYPLFVPNILSSSGGNNPWTTPDSSTEKIMWRGRLAQVTHPKLIVDGDWGYATGAGTATYRLKVNNTTIGTWTATTLETSNHVYDNLSNLHQQNLDVSITLQCSTNAGTAQVRCAPYGLSQRQT